MLVVADIIIPFYDLALHHTASLAKLIHCINVRVTVGTNDFLHMVFVRDWVIPAP